MANRSPIRYRDAGVNIDEADRAVASVKKLAKATFTPGVLSGIGSFGAMYALSGLKKPVLISSADGVGTKLKVAFATGIHSTIGEDLVNHCVNDIAVQGARPLFFLDYFATGRLEAKVAAQVITGIARGCRNNGCALIGGETAEMPGMYTSGEYDLAGFIVGAAERDRLLTGESIQAGDQLIGLASTGLHTNGYSLARKLFFEVAGLNPASRVPELHRTVSEELLQVHRSYLKPITALHTAGLLAGAAHITGGGITENTPRMLPKGLAARIRIGSWKIPPVFPFLQRIGEIPDDDYRRTFNLGIGMILAIPARQAAKALKVLDKLREKYFVIGEVAPAPSRSRSRVLYE